MSTDTIIDKILRGEIPSDKVYEDDTVYAFRDIEPQAPTHVLVVPKQKIRDFAELLSAEAEWVGSFMQGIARVASQLGLDDAGYRVVFNTGPDALQSIDYIHAHILGGRRMGWPPG